MSQPPARITVVLRTAGEPALLRRSLADVARQTCIDWHLIVVDSSGTPGVVAGLVAELDPAVAERITVLAVDPASGPGAAANAGIQAFEAGFVAIHDHDTWDPRFLERTLAHLDRHPSLSAVATLADVVTDEVRADEIVEVGRRAQHPDGLELTLTDLLRTNRLFPGQLVYRRRVHDTLGLWREDLPEASGWEFHLRLVTAFEVGVLAETLAVHHVRDENVGGQQRGEEPNTNAHDRAEFLVRDDALRARVAEHGLGDLLYLTRLLHDEFEHLHRLNADLIAHIDGVQADLAARIDGLQAEVGRLHQRVDRGSEHYNEWLGHLQRRLDDIEATTREVSLGATLRRQAAKVNLRKR